MKDLQTFKKELLADEATRREYEKLAPQYAVISQLIAARIKKKLTQKQLAAKMKTKQSVISRFESGNINPSIGFLEKVASAIGYKLTIKLQA